MNITELKEELNFELNKQDFNPNEIVNLCNSYLISQKEITKKEIIEASALACNIEVDEMYKKNRAGLLPLSRHLYYWYHRTFNTQTVSSLGVEFGQNHASVIHGVKSINNALFVKDKLVTDVVRKFKKSVGK